MKERPILFSAPMVRAILEGRKTMTRRLVNMKHLAVEPRGFVYGDGPYATTNVMAHQRTPAFLNRCGAVSAKATNGSVLGLKPGEFDFVCPYADGKTKLIDGKWHIIPQESRLWVRETWQPVTRDIAGFWVRYAADESEAAWAAPYEYSPLYDGKWKPSIFMPRWASRITLEITDIRVERLQDISETDAKAEGCEIGEQLANQPKPTENDCTLAVTCKEAFRYLWDSLNAKRGYGWETNLFVWVVSFKRMETQP